MSDDSGGKHKSFIEKLFGSKPSKTVRQETEDEILSLVEEGQEMGYIEDRTKSIIENIFDFDDTCVGEIMTHRTEMLALDETLPLQQVVKAAIESGYSRIPVFHDDVDNIIGVLYVKDLLRYVCAEVPEDFRLNHIIRPVLFVPRTKNCAQLFSEMTKKKIQLAIVVDEYGGTEGLVTLEDLIEDILGSIQDEYDHEEEDYRKLAENKFTVDGSMTISDVEELIKVKLPESESDTIAGFVLEQLGTIPKNGENPKIIIGDISLTVTETEERRISKILIEKTEKEQNASGC